MDGIFGTGVRFPISSFIYDIFELINKYSDQIISVDIPSGVHGDTGAVSTSAVKAKHTLAISFPKIGHYVGMGAQLIGRLTIIDAGFKRDFNYSGDKFLLTKEFVHLLMKKRNKFAHKNFYGHTLVIGGSKGLCGALSLASRAALRVGSGLVTAVTWSESYNEYLAHKIPEIMAAPLSVEMSRRAELIDNLSKV